MTESALCFHNLEWPARGARIAGPAVWLRGWVVGKPGTEFIDLRARTAHGVFLGVLGLPRTDLAAHFAPHRAWLPAEFIVAVAAPDGALRVELEAQEARGNWIALETVELTVAPDGARNARTEGELVPAPGGGHVVRVPHLPLHGHLDEPGATPAALDGVLPVFGWFVHDRHRISRVSATLDTRTFVTLASGLTDDVLAQKVPQLPAARHGRVRGAVPFFATHFAPVCLRVYVELDDGSVQLALARRVSPQSTVANVPTAAPAPAEASLPAFPSCRPRRLLIVLRTLHADDGTRRALDLVRWLRTDKRWAARAIAAEDGPLRTGFEAAGCEIQMIDLRALTAAQGPAAAELAALDRTIWWRHLDAAALFDATSEWIAPLAQRHDVPLFRDPARALPWFALEERPEPDANGPVVAPIRGLAVHGAPTLIGALADRSDLPEIVINDVRGSEEEEIFRSSCAGTALRLATAPGAVAAVVCPAWRDHPIHALLTAAASGVPVITTPNAELAATFAHGEVVFIDAGNPLALAHALTDLRANPAATERRAAAARRVTEEAHAPARQLPRWIGALEAALAAR